MKMKTKKKGFTLIELLVCLFIIGLNMLEHNTKEVPTVDELLNKKYIDQKQLDAYKKVDPKLITPAAQ